MYPEKDPWHAQSVSTDRLIEVGGNINEHLETPVPPHVESFARCLSAPWAAYREEYGVAYKVVPADMTLNANSLLDDIRTKGRYNHTHLEYMTPDLLEVTPEQLAELYLAVPVIARASFPGDFADAVEERWRDTLKYWSYMEDLPRKVVVSEIEPVGQDITSAAEAKTLLVDYAREKVVALDWQWALEREVYDTYITALFDTYFPHVLNENRIAPLLNVLYKAYDPRALNDLADHQKVSVGKNSVLAMAFDRIEAKDATLLRDILCTLSVEKIANYLGNEEAAGKLVAHNPGLAQAIARCLEYGSSK